MAHNDPFIGQIGPTKNFLRGFTNFFFETTGLQDKLLTLIESPNIFHWKLWSVGQNLDQIWYNVVRKERKTGILNSFF